MIQASYESIVRFAELTSVLHGQQGTTSAKKAFSPNLQKFADIKTSSQTVRSDLITLLKEIRTIAEGRGRKLKSKNLALEYAFGECDTQNGGGGTSSFIIGTRSVQRGGQCHHNETS